MDVDISVPRVIPPFRNDPYSPILFASPPVEISREQEDAIRAVLLLASSDTRFAQKAADALRVILLGGSVPGIQPPVITSLEPANKVQESPSFKLKTKGTGFSQGHVIHVNGNPMPTTYISATELNTDISLVGVTGPKTYPVNVRTISGILSNTVDFTVTTV